MGSSAVSELGFLFQNLDGEGQGWLLKLPRLTFVSQDGHCDGEEGTEHIEQCDGCPQRPVIFTLGALRTLLDSCNTQQNCVAQIKMKYPSSDP